MNCLGVFVSCSVIGQEICILDFDWSNFSVSPAPFPYLESAAVRRPFGTRGVDRWTVGVAVLIGISAGGLRMSAVRLDKFSSPRYVC